MSNIIVADDLVFPDDSGQPVTSSLLVAEKFEKRHDHVLDKIRGLIERCPEHAPNFREVEYLDAKGENRPYFLITEKGFLKLALSFTGEKAERWQWAFIDAFQAMKNHLLDTRQTLESMLCRVTDVMTTAHAALAVEVKEVKQDVREVKQDVRDLRTQVTNFAAIANQRRRTITEMTKREHRLVLHLRAYACPCCCRVQDPSQFEFDHFFSNSQADFLHTWPLCRPCHGELTAGRRARGDVRSDFDAYQAFAARELPKQGTLFVR